ncbi:hypothetical protein cypCar_00003335 [Cyprinus carpio]|nr:hypothetical protein cypCar_00003335 [Cyprinus carpio]
MFLVLVVTEELREFLARARSGAGRLIQVLIRDEQLVLGAYREPRQSWDKDYDHFLLPLLDPNEPCYILYRMDTKNAQGYEWLFISWSPDQSPEDVCLQGYLRHVTSCSAPAPLTAAEQELQRIKITEGRVKQVKTEITVDPKHQTLQGLAFPLQAEAKRALQQLAERRINYIQLKLDTEKERIDLVHTSPTEIRDLPCRIPLDTPRYHFFLYKHSHEGDYLESVDLEKLSIILLSHQWILCSEWLEIDSGEELTEEYLYDEVHPKQHAHKQAFAKPRGPAGKRGNKRIIKGGGENGGNS